MAPQPKFSDTARGKQMHADWAEGFKTLLFGKRCETIYNASPSPNPISLCNIYGQWLHQLLLPPKPGLLFINMSNPTPGGDIMTAVFILHEAVFKVDKEWLAGLNHKKLYKALRGLRMAIAHLKKAGLVTTHVATAKLAYEAYMHTGKIMMPHLDDMLRMGLTVLTRELAAAKFRKVSIEQAMEGLELLFGTSLESEDVVG